MSDLILAVPSKEGSKKTPLAIFANAGVALKRAGARVIAAACRLAILTRNMSRPRKLPRDWPMAGAYGHYRRGFAARGNPRYGQCGAIGFAAGFWPRRCGGRHTRWLGRGRIWPI